MQYLDPETEELLKEILGNDTNYPEILRKKFLNITHEEDTRLRAKIKLLIDEGYISKIQWGDNVPYRGRIEQKGRSYFIMKEQEETKHLNTWEKLLYKLRNAARDWGNAYSVMSIELTNDEKVTLGKLQDLNLICNVRRMGMNGIIGCDLTYDGWHYFENKNSQGEPTTQITPAHGDTVFISHSSNDKDFVIKLSQFLTLLGVKRENIFCSSIEGQGVQHGKKIEESVRNKIIENRILIYVISESFMRSEYCLNELGAGWILGDSRTQNKDIFIIKLSDIGFEDMRGFIDSSNITTLPNEDSITTFVEELEEVLKLPTKKPTEYRNLINTFIKDIS